MPGKWFQHWVMWPHLIMLCQPFAARRHHEIMPLWLELVVLMISALLTARFTPLSSPLCYCWEMSNPADFCSTKCSELPWKRLVCWIWTKSHLCVSAIFDQSWPGLWSSRKCVRRLQCDWPIAYCIWRAPPPRFPHSRPWEKLTSLAYCVASFHWLNWLLGVQASEDSKKHPLLDWTLPCSKIA